MGPGEIAGIVIGGLVLLFAATYGLNKLTSANPIRVDMPDTNAYTTKQQELIGIDADANMSDEEHDNLTNTLQWGGYSYNVPCTLPGFEWTPDWYKNAFFPQGIVLSTSILFYYLFFLKDSSRPQLLPGISIGIILIGQIMALWLNGCFDKYTNIILILQLFGAVAIGTITAGIGYAIVEKTDYRPFSSFSEQFTTFSAKKEENTPPAKKMVLDVFGPPPATTAVSGDSTCKPSGTGKCLPPSDEDQFVCEAYRDGELVTATIVS